VGLGVGVLVAAWVGSSVGVGVSTAPQADKSMEKITNRLNVKMIFGEVRRIFLLSAKSCIFG
jgi:hypothetical protein